MGSPGPVRCIIPVLALFVVLQGVMLFYHSAVLDDMVGRNKIRRFLSKKGSFKIPPEDAQFGGPEVVPGMSEHIPEAATVKHAKVEVIAQDTRDRVQAAERPKVKELAPEAPESAEAQHNATFCNASVTVYTPETDARCIAYLENTDNIAHIAPMASIMALARTIKYKVKYKSKHVKAILKVGQNNFPFEPYSEYLGFKIDRLLGMDKVPPTGWVHLPIPVLNASLDVLTDQSFKDWVQTDVFEFPEVKKHLLHVAGVPHMPMSVQLWVADIHPLQNTEWSVGGDWKSYFTPGSPADTPALPHLSDIIVLDYILSNPDRRPDKNNYVAGGCRKDCQRRKGDLPHVGEVSLVPIDQGSSFYGPAPPDSNPLTPGSNSFCRFRRETAERVLKLKGDVSWSSYNKHSNSPFHKAVLRSLGPHEDQILAVIKWQRIHWAQDRLNTLAAHIESCKQRFGATRVTCWD